MPETVFDTIRIVLVEPAGALNVGSIARVMKNMGLHHLVLVNPHCDPVGAEARQMAVHADDVLATASIVATLPDALRGCQRAIATTARARSVATLLEHPRAALPWLIEASPPNMGAIVFGPEDRGLSNAELDHAQRFVGIPSNPAYPSLNLAQAVAICCYELYQLVWDRSRADRGIGGQDDMGMSPAGGSSPQSASPIAPIAASEPPFAAAPIEVLEAYYQHLEDVLLKIGYLYPHTAFSRMQKFRRLFNRALPSDEEVAMLRGILSQVDWATKKLNERKTDVTDDTIAASD